MSWLSQISIQHCLWFTYLKHLCFIFELLHLQVYLFFWVTCKITAHTITLAQHKTHCQLGYTSAYFPGPVIHVLTVLLQYAALCQFPPQDVWFCPEECPNLDLTELVAQSKLSLLMGRPLWQPQHYAAKPLTMLISPPQNICSATLHWLFLLRWNKTKTFNKNWSHKVRRWQKVLTNPISCLLTFYLICGSLVHMLVWHITRCEWTSIELWQSIEKKSEVIYKNSDFYDTFDPITWSDLTHLSQTQAWYSADQVSPDAARLKPMETQLVSRSRCLRSSCVNSRQHQSAERLFMFLHAVCLLSLTWLLWP